MNIQELVSMSASMQLKNISACYGDAAVLEGLSLDVSHQEILCVLGTSGSGKSTLLKAIAGLIPLTSGSISLHDKVLSKANYLVPPENRKIGLIFQDYALFPHLSVMQNIAFSGVASDQQIEDLIQLFGLQGLAQRYPHELSGGQQQRVAIARAMAYQPEFLLMDEPFSNIDQQTRWPLISELHDIFRQQKMGVVFVTHSIDEAFYLADRIAVLEQGQVRQCDTPENLYKKPLDWAVADFLDLGLTLPILKFREDHIICALGSCRIHPDDSNKMIKNQSTHVYFNTEKLKFSCASDGAFTVIERKRLAQNMGYTFAKDGTQFTLNLSLDYDFAVNSKVHIDMSACEARLLM